MEHANPAVEQFHDGPNTFDGKKNTSLEASKLSLGKYDSYRRSLSVSNVVHDNTFSLISFVSEPEINNSLGLLGYDPIKWVVKVAIYIYIYILHNILHSCLLCSRHGPTDISQ